MKIYIACDHRGIDLKNKLIKYLKENGLNIIDIGIPNSDLDDYPDFAFKLGELVREDANKVKGIRCVRAVSVDDAFKGKNHNGCNVIAIGSEVTTDINVIKEMIDTFINTKKASEERHLKRINVIEKYEEGHL